MWCGGLCVVRVSINSHVSIKCIYDMLERCVYIIGHIVNRGAINTPQTTPLNGASINPVNTNNNVVSSVFRASNNSNNICTYKITINKKKLSAARVQ